MRGIAAGTVERVREAVPLEARHRVAKLRQQARTPTGRWRTLPGALVIGVQRGGTSSLYRTLGAHPGTAPSSRKEVEYFTRGWHRGERWYRGHFALGDARGRLAFEATPDYLLHPLAAGRAARTVAGARIVVLLRDPVARAVSHHRHMVRLGYEDLPLAEALAREDERCAPDLDRLLVDPLHDPKALLRFSYAMRGRYAEQLARWLAVFPAEQLLVLRSEDWFARPQEVFPRLLDFLGLAPREPRAFRNASARLGSGEAAVDAAVTARLRRAYAGQDDELRALLGPSAPRWTV